MPAFAILGSVLPDLCQQEGVKPWPCGQLAMPEEVAPVSGLAEAIAFTPGAFREAA